MAQKKKKGSPPATKEIKRKRLSIAQIFFIGFSLIIVLSMVFGMFASFFQ